MSTVAVITEDYVSDRIRSFITDNGGRITFKELWMKALLEITTARQANYWRYAINKLQGKLWDYETCSECQSDCNMVLL